MKKLTLLFVLFFSAVFYSQSYQPYMTALGFPDAWNITEGNEDVIIAVLGNGIHTDHPALVNSISSIPGWNFYDNNNNVTETRSGPDYSHETSAAGIIAAQHTVYNNYIVRGLAPDCKIMPVKFYEPEDENDPLMAQKLESAFNYVRDKQLQYPNKRFLINLSYSFTDFNQTEKDLVISAIQNCYNIGIPVFCSAGNNTGQPVEFPAQLSTTFAITCVIGIDYNYVYNNLYPTGTNLDLAAPEHILYTTYSNNSYYNFGQTSGAAPQACAAAALFLSIEPTFPLEELRRVLHRNTFTDILDGTTGNPITYNEDGYNNKVGYGRVSALNSLGKHNIVFLNNVEGNTSIGQITVEGQTLNSGNDLLFFRGEEVNAIAYDGTYNYNNLENKFYKWNIFNYSDPNASDRDRINNFFSDQLFDIPTNNAVAFFKKTTPLTVRNYLEGGNGGMILFGEKDFDVVNRNSPYTENAFIYNLQGGVNAIYRAEAEPTHNLFNTTWNFWKWENSSANRIREAQINQTTPIEWRANYKGQFRSDDQNGISSNSQRKIVRTDNGIYHVVYESLGQIWYTHSLTTDYYGSWSQDYNIINGEDGQAKNPSIDFEGNKIKIVFEFYAPMTYPDAAIFLVTWQSDVNGNYYQSEGEDVLHYSSSYFGNAKPVIAYNNVVVFLAYRKNLTGSIYEKSKWLSSGTWQWGSEGMILNTASNSKNPTLAGRAGYVDIAYEHSTSIKYIHGYNQSTNWIYVNEEIISAGCGYSHNYCPSISLMGNGKPIVSWTGARKETTEEDGLGKETEAPGLNAFRLIARPKASSWGNFYVAGDNVVYTNNNSTTGTNEETIITFSAENGTVSKWIKRYGSAYTWLNNLSHTGKQIQVCGAEDLSTMKALVFNSSSLPYPINKSTSVFSDYLGKTTVDSIPTFGRTGVVYKNGVEFVFFLGDVLLNNENVMFIERADTLPVPDIIELNDAMKTNTFSLNSNSDLYFSVSYGVINSDLADSVLIENDVVTFRVELVNSENNQVVGTFDEVIYNLNNLNEYDNVDYKVDCAGIATGNYFFRLVTSVQGDAGLFLSNVQNDNEMLLKKSYQTVKFNKELLPIEYALEQNYPNPFNPSTTIRYQIPKEGMVTLKVYDILGAEVATLVNEEKIAGRYEVNFDASRLASGVYIYRLNVNDFVNVKKMVLLK